MDSDTIVIGGGPAGLGTASALKARGVEVQVLDERQQVGDSWRRHYDSLELNSVKSLSAMPGMKMPSDFPRYPSRDQMVTYLEAYARDQHISPVFGQRVELVQHTAQGWELKTPEKTWRARHVVIATGRNCTPQIPAIDGLENFPGRAIHSHDYRNINTIQGDRVLVVGAGNSAADIVVDLVRQGKQVDIVIRGKTYVTPLELLGVPSQITSTMLGKLPLPLADVVAKTALGLRFGNLAKHGIPCPDDGPISQIVKHGRVPMFDRGIIKLIKTGKVKVLPAVKKVEGNTISFVDDTCTQYDSLIFATGYTTGLKELLLHSGYYLDDQGWPLIKARDAGDGLYFVGFNETTRGLLNEIKHEAVSVARQIASDQTYSAAYSTQDKQARAESTAGTTTQ